MTTPEARQAGPPRIQGRVLWLWVATIISFPIAGVLAKVIGGSVTGLWTGIVAGAIAGAVIGSAQWFALRSIGVSPLWIPATAIGLGAGLGLGVAVFGYDSSIAGLALVGAVSGLGIGIAQWVLLRGVVGASLAWVPATAAFWALGWTITTSIGVDVELRWAVFGLSGAASVVVLSAGLLWLLGRAESPALG